jgi:hypothetical protein
LICENFKKQNSLLYKNINISEQNGFYAMDELTFENNPCKSMYFTKWTVWKGKKSTDGHLNRWGNSIWQTPTFVSKKNQVK